MRRPTLSYANVVATLALVLALGGTALAAQHYIITSTGQIKPSVLRKLRGRTGPRGPSGVKGAPGTASAYCVTPASHDVSHAITVTPDDNGANLGDTFTVRNSAQSYCGAQSYEVFAFRLGPPGGAPYGPADVAFQFVVG